jgi:hypothetical protein
MRRRWWRHNQQPHPNAHAFRNRHIDAYTHADADLHSNTDTNALTDTITYADPISDTDPSPHSCPHANANPHTDTYADTPAEWRRQRLCKPRRWRDPGPDKASDRLSHRNRLWSDDQRQVARCRGLQDQFAGGLRQSR